MEQTDEPVSCAVYITRKEKKVVVGAAVHRRIPRAGMEDAKQFSLELFEFLDGEQFSGLDAFFVQLGACKLFLSEDFEDSSRGDGRKISNLLYGKEQISVKFIKKGLFTNKKGDTNGLLLHLVGQATHGVNNAEHQTPLGFACIDVIAHELKLSSNDHELSGRFNLILGSISSFMRLDSAAAEAVNLLPKSDHPSAFG